MTVEERIAYTKERNLTQLDLSNLGLSEIPDSVYELAQLRTLILGKNYAPNEDQSNRNRIIFIPMSITLLRNLEGIGLAHNNIEEFPSFLLQLPKLRTIMLNYNRITELPAEIGQMRQLKVLGLEGNQLTALPAEIGLLRNLQVLGLAKNKLTKLPPSFVGLQGLQQLGLANNQFDKIPSELFDLTKIRAIGLANNNISVFPEGISRLTRLDKLNLKDNPLDPRFIELANRGSRAVNAWITEQKKRKQRLLNQIIRGKKEAQDRINIRSRLAYLLKPNKLVCEVCNGHKKLDGYDVHLKTHFNNSVCYGCQGKGEPDETTEELHDIIETCNQYKENYREQIIGQAQAVKAFQTKIPAHGHHSDILFQETRDNLRKILKEKQERLSDLLERFSLYESFERKIHVALYNFHILQMTRRQNGTDLSFESIDKYSEMYGMAQVAAVVVNEVEQVFQSLDSAMSEEETTELKEKLAALIKEFDGLGKVK